MMQNPHDVYNWSRLYREERLDQARTIRLERRLRTNSEGGKNGLYQVKEVLSMRRIVLIVMVAAIMAASVAFSAPAFASHEHYLLTPGTCVEDLAGGQTAKGPGEGGYHRFHGNVHKGRPGTTAFENIDNPIGVDKGSCPD
jgi:hypothetical protein